jgi:hypothetical protein
MTVYRGKMRFRTWLHQEEEELNKLKHVVDMHGLVLFFKRGDSYFGAGEDSRVIFARLKKPDEDMSKGWEDEASFTALNLSKLAKGHPAQHVFDKEDIKKIKVMDKDEVVEKIKDQPAESGEPMKFSALRIIKIGHSMPNNDRDDAPNFVRADEE